METVPEPQWRCTITGVDGYRHLVLSDEWLAVKSGTRPAHRTLCQCDVNEGALSSAAEPCRDCRLVADHLELADPLNIGNGNRIRNFLAALAK
jgi:hypothetical protein